MEAWLSHHHPQHSPTLYVHLDSVLPIEMRTFPWGPVKGTGERKISVFQEDVDGEFDCCDGPLTAHADKGRGMSTSRVQDVGPRERLPGLSQSLLARPPSAALLGFFPQMLKCRRRSHTPSTGREMPLSMYKSANGDLSIQNICLGWTQQRPL